MKIRLTLLSVRKNSRIREVCSGIVFVVTLWVMMCLVSLPLLHPAQVPLIIIGCTLLIESADHLLVPSDYGIRIFHLGCAVFVASIPYIIVCFIQITD